jgi:hypothetical protein
MARGQSFEQCVEAVAAAGKIGKQAALDLLGQVDERAEAMRRTACGPRCAMAIYCWDLWHGLGRMS